MLIFDVGVVLVEANVTCNNKGDCEQHCALIKGQPQCFCDRGYQLNKESCEGMSNFPPVS